MTYQEKKAEYRQEAIEWQHTYGNEPHYMSEDAYWADWWRYVGKRYGLLKEFRENGIL